MGDETSIYKEYVCSQCGAVKKIMVNHYMPELWNRCSDECMWSDEGELGPYLYSANGEKTAFRKRKFSLAKDLKK